MAITAVTSYRMIKKKKFTATFETVASDSVDPTIGARTQGTETDHTVFIVPPMIQKKYSSGNGVPEGLQVMLFSPNLLDFTPFLGQKITINEEIWIIQDFETVSNIAGEIVLYEAGVRQ